MSNPDSTPDKTPDKTLAELGITLPDAPAPKGSYVPYVISGTMLYVSGQVSATEDGPLRGKLGDDMNIEDGAAAALTCGVFLLAQARKACGGDLGRIKRVVRLGGFVNCTADFTDQPKVINGASDLMVAIFGDAGRHARAAVGASSLPLGVAVEIDAVFELTE